VLHDLRLPEQTVASVSNDACQRPQTRGRLVGDLEDRTLRGDVLGNAGIQDPAGREGIDDIVEGLFSYGTATYDRLAYQTESTRSPRPLRPARIFSLDVPVERVRTRRHPAGRRRTASASFRTMRSRSSRSKTSMR